MESICLYYSVFAVRGIRRRMREPYAKENNLLQLSLFKFSKRAQKHFEIKWSNGGSKCKLTCDCSYGVPGSFEQDVYTACMRIWFKSGMPHTIVTNYSEIARELHVHQINWNRRIKKALLKLVKARYEFHECWVDREKGDMANLVIFSLFDSASLFFHRKGESKRFSKIKLIIPREILCNLEAKYYQLLDMEFYRALPQGISRRLYEYLEKKRHLRRNGMFKITEEKLCRWLPVTDSNTTNRRKTIERAAGALQDAGYLKKITRDLRKIWHFTYEKRKKDAKREKPQKSRVRTVDTGEICDRRGSEVALLQKSGDETQNKNVSEGKSLESGGGRDGLRGEIAAWLDTVPGFSPARKAELLEKDTLDNYREVRDEYERRIAEGKKKKPGPKWVYKSLLEGWRFREDKDFWKEYCSWKPEDRDKFADVHVDTEAWFDSIAGDGVEYKRQVVLAIRRGYGK